jgi:hypothetical protein
MREQSKNPSREFVCVLTIPLAYAFRIRAYTALNRFDEAKATYAQALERKLHTPFIDVVMYELAFAQNDTAGMAQHVAKLGALPQLGWKMLSMEGDTAAYSGHLKDARELSRRAMDNAQRAGEKDAPALYSGTSGLREAWFGNTDEARRRATLALKLSSGRDLQYFAALAFAYASDDARAKALADDLDKSFRKTQSCSSIICRASAESLRSTKEMLLAPLRVLGRRTL